MNSNVTKFRNPWSLKLCPAPSITQNLVVNHCKKNCTDLLAALCMASPPSYNVTQGLLLQQSGEKQHPPWRKRNAPALGSELIQTSCRSSTHTHTHWVNFGRQEEGVSLMVDQELFFKNILAQWKRRICVWFRRTIKPDETGSEAAARASSPVQLTVCIPVSFKSSLYSALSTLKSPHPRCATAGPGAAIHQHIDTQHNTHSMPRSTKRKETREKWGGGGSNWDRKPATDPAGTETCREQVHLGELTCSGAAQSAGYWVESELNPLSVKQRGENDRAAAEQAETALLEQRGACAVRGETLGWRGWGEWN